VACVGAQAGAGYALGHYLGLRKWAIAESRDADAAVLRYNTPRATAGCAAFYVRSSENSYSRHLGE
jgi:hypothetical protein